MSETSPPSIPTHPAAPPPVATSREHAERLYQAAAWAALVAGVALIAAVVLHFGWFLFY